MTKKRPFFLSVLWIWLNQPLLLTSLVLITHLIQKQLSFYPIISRFRSYDFFSTCLQLIKLYHPTKSYKMFKMGHVLAVPKKAIVVFIGCTSVPICTMYMMHNLKLLDVSSMLKPQKNQNSRVQFGTFWTQIE